MITPDKTYSTNPFVDNMVYYAKLMALNCTIKDEEEALSYETKESLYAADVLIACVEKKSNYEMFKSIPKEILEKYIPSTSNLDLYTKDVSALKAHLNSYSKYQRTKIYNNLSSLARTVYIDHFDMMSLYVNEAGPTWIEDKKILYDNCKNGTATYEVLFNELPMKTVLRILKKYLNAYDYAKLSQMWDETGLISIEDILALIPRDGSNPPSSAELNSRTDDQNQKTLLLDTNYIYDNLDQFVESVDESRITGFLEQFDNYVSGRTDTDIVEELNRISKAMREVFIDHYNMMLKRQIFAGDYRYGDENEEETPEEETYEADWAKLSYNKQAYDECKAGTATCLVLYNFFPYDILRRCLVEVLGEADVEDYNLMSSVTILDSYFSDGYCDDPVNKKNALTEKMVNIYLDNYNLYMNNNIYLLCQQELIDYYDLIEYIPVETLKMILLTEFDEVTNLQVYSNNKRMLNSYLNTLNKSEADRIKASINSDMQSWYPENHIETNNYYRALIGLPPMDSSGRVYEDTLIHSYDPDTGSFMEFGNTYISKAPTNIYPSYHWRQEFYKYDSYDISILQEYGLIEDFVAACGSDINKMRYRYLKYLGDDKLNLYECRKAQNFQLIGMPTVDDQEAKAKFTDCYAVNRDFVIRTVYSDAFKFQSDYYNKFIIIFILVNTIMDMLSSIPDMIINRDVFDARCIKYLFESFGIPYYSEIPLKYQKAMLKNLNILIKYKSSTKNMVDICSLFGFRDVKVFGYYMMKDREVDNYTGEYILDEDTYINYSAKDVYVLDMDAKVSPYSNYDPYLTGVDAYLLKDNTLLKNIDYEVSKDTDSEQVADPTENIFFLGSNSNIIDISGRRFTRLKEYRYYNEDYYYNTIKVKQDDGTIVEKKILNNERELFVYDEENNEMIPLKDTTYFTQVKADTAPASLKFVKVPLEEQLTAYKKDTDYILDYDEITSGDQYWDAEEDHDVLKQKILDYEFNAVKSKYISIETATDMTELAFEMSYFYSMIFDNYYSEDALTLNIPYIRASHKFKFTDVLCYLFALMYYYYGLKDNIMYSPTQILYVKGYNFNEDLNKVLKDATCFTQKDEYGDLQDYEKENIFNVNDRIAEDNYDYQQEFDKPEYYVKAFNLQADIDELDKWLINNYQMSLSDLIVDDTLTTFDKVITVKSFYTLNNSYYQKSIFNGNMTPAQYNNDIKYGYDYDLAQKLYFNDISSNPHMFITEKVESANDIGMSFGYIEGIFAIVPKYTKVPSSTELMERAKWVTSVENLYDDNYILTNIFPFDDETAEKIKEDIGYKYYIEIIDDPSTIVYIFNNSTYAINPNGNAIAVFNQYSRYNNTYIRMTPQYYIISEGTYKPLINGSIRVKNSNGLFIFGTDHVYKRLSDGKYEEITDASYFTPEAGSKYSILNFNQEYYYTDEDGNYVLDPKNCYIKITQNGVDTYILLTNIAEYNNLIVKDSDCYIRHSDGHFVRFDYTDYYIRTHNDHERANEAIYKEEELYVITDDETEYYDPSVEPRVYYKRIEDFYAETNYTVYKDTLYVLDSNGNYIPENNLVSPINCYYFDYEYNDYRLITRAFYNYGTYESTRDIRYVLIRQPNNDYYKYELNVTTYELVESNAKRYVYNSDTDYILIINKEAIYNDTKSLLVVFNKDMNVDTLDEIIADEDKYNPSLHDNVWDENDWYYESASSDPNNKLNKNTENIWYYIPEGESREITNEAAKLRDIIGSGYYLSSDQYIGNVELVEGEEYYIAFDIETNFDGSMNAFCAGDSNVSNSSDRVYYFSKGEKQHISQVFTANGNKTPDFRIIKYGFISNPIIVGDYIVISNMRVLKSYSDDFISNDIPSYNDLDKIYKTNTAIYKYLVSQMLNTDDYETYNIYKKLYDSLMIAKYNKEAFKLSDGTYALTFTDFLQTRDEILYDKLEHFKEMEPEAMQNAIADEIIEITYAMNDAIGQYGYDHLYSYFPGVSVNFIQDYIYKIINWFKSWKVQLLSINTVYRLGGVTSGDPNVQGSAFDNSDYLLKILHDEEYRIKLRENYKEGFVYGEAKVNPFDDVSPDGTPYSEKYEFDPSHEFRNKVRIRDRVRIIARTSNSLDYTDNQTNLHLRLSDDTTKVKVEDLNKLKITTINGDAFSYVDQNNMWMTTDETQEDMFASQIIDEINLLSGDYIDFDELEDDE